MEPLPPFGTPAPPPVQPLESAPPPALAEPMPPLEAAPVPAPAEPMTAEDFLAAAGVTGRHVEIVMRFNSWAPSTPLPVDALERGLSRALHERI